MFARLLSPVLLVCLMSGQGLAGPVRDLAASMRFTQLFEVLQDEGLRFGESLQADLFPGEGGARWRRDVARIHDAATMQELAEADLEERLENQPEALARMKAFFDSPTGQKISDLEIAARRAYLDDRVKAAAERAWGNFGVDLPGRVVLIETLVETNDLIEQNVAGGMNANLAFYQGMRAAGAFGEDVPEPDMMADLWSQEDAIREETAGWLLPYLAMAYRPLSDAELSAYVAFSKSPDGQLLNRALFATFDKVFVTVSRDLGTAAAGMLNGRDI
ncbi:DUF2059 domain-containing protein [Falsigemmobacter faecalis]|uniref:DUF2059 domain-containing protein n=1 Tax=Falsigemmobacter faecalis TaxID=2488730 RepID=A0A3P3DSR4_9RHOB|nr:DUF2059 domain-containing protein [Falsigemmobacter faecalis]RRH77269.1 DUF2059 domain-containing protein [Falsigemmobacter faecalis]